MTKCIVVEDEPFAQKLLAKYIRQIPSLQLVECFSKPALAMAFLEKETIDLIFLDIEMPEMNGMDMFALLPASTQVIFTTAYSEHAVESYTKGATDYLLKPIHFDRLLTAIDRANQQKASQPATAGKDLFIKEGRHYVRLNLDEVTYIKGLKDYVEFKTANARHVVLDNLKRLEESLPANFMRVHYSYIVNCNWVLEFRDNLAGLPGIKVPVSKKYYEQFMQRINDKLL